jgi:hypothetical protein
MSNVWAVCCGEYDDFRVLTVYLTEAEARLVTEKANLMRAQAVGAFEQFYVIELPLAATPMFEWVVTEPEGRMRKANVVFKPVATFPYKHPSYGGWSVNGTDHDDVLSAYRSRVDGQ